ncbi:MAG TPA: hypothetical protein PK447_09365 [Ignavibacteria bacterium]|nr:hypothetical protein [Ignavibacteria bacterium]
MKLNRIILSMVVIICLLFQNGGVMYLYDFIQEKIKEESKVLLSNEEDIPESSITQIIISKNNPDNSIILEDSEIIMNGMRYDIISKDEDENNLYFKVYCDTKESEFVANATSNINKSENSKQHSRSVTSQNLLTITGVISSDYALSLNEDSNILRINKSDFYISYITDSPTPPPKTV